MHPLKAREGIPCRTYVAESLQELIFRQIERGGKMVQELKRRVCEANQALEQHGLIILTWGNVSGIDRAAGLVVIKPSGVAYCDLAPDSMVVVDLDGRIVEGRMRPSSDLPTHLELYRCFPEIGAVTHTHSPNATAFAQAGRPVPCLGTTHADYFHGPVPITRALARAEIQDAYELNTGRVIVERFTGLDPMRMPAVLVAHHGPFTWGRTPEEAVENCAALEAVAVIAMKTIAIAPGAGDIPRPLADKHFLRKHGPTAYYGQDQQPPK